MCPIPLEVFILKKRKLSLNTVAAFNFLGPVVLNGLSFLTMPLFTRLLGTANYGNYTNYNSYLSILAVLVGFQAAGSIAPTSIRYDSRERDRVFSNIMTAAIASAILIGGMVAIFQDPISEFTGLPKHMLVVLFFHAVGMFAVQFSTTKFAYDKESHKTFLVSVAISVVSILLSVLLICMMPAHVAPYESYIYGHAVPYILAGFGLMVYFLLKGKSFFDKKHWAYVLALCLPLIFHQLSNSLLHQCDKIMLKRITGDSFAGIYGFAVTFSTIMSIIWAALNNTFIPFYHDDIKAEKPDALRKKTKNYLYLFTSLTMGFVLVMPEVVKIFASQDFWQGIELIPLLVLGAYFVFLYSFPVNFEFYHCRTKTIAVGTGCAALVNIILNATLIPRFGMLGAAVATVVSYLFLWLFHLFVAKVVIKEAYHFDFRFFYGYLVAVLLLIGLYYLIADLWLIRWLIFTVIAIALLIKTYRQKSLF